MQEIHIYTDGGCSGNPGPGAWAYLILENQSRRAKSGGERSTTNNRMELRAIICALQDLSATHTESGKGELALQVFTDSMYVKKGITEWIKNWEKNGWKNAAREPVKNQDLWQE